MARQPAPPLYTRRPVLAGVLRQLPLTAVLLVVAAGLATVALGNWRRGLVLLALALIGTALLRLLLPAVDWRVIEQEPYMMRLLDPAQAIGLRRFSHGVDADLPFVLVDDVHTSGATVDACTAALLDAGAAKVSILCWARVLDGDD